MKLALLMAVGRLRRSSCAPLALLALALAHATALAAPPASPLLPPDHWAVHAADRLEALGLVDGWMPSQKAVPVLVVADALARADERSRTDRPELAPVIAAWREQLALEARAGGRARLALNAFAGGGYESATARELAPSTEPQAVHLDPFPDRGFASAGAALRIEPYFAVAASGRATKDDLELRDGEVVAALGAWSLSVGRARAGFGFSPVGGVMLSGAAVLDRVELMTTEPLRLPWALGRLGLWTLDAFVARLDEPRHPGDPLFWATSVRWRLHPRLTLGVQRALVFGGEPWRGFPAWHRAVVLLGFDNYRENNMLSVNARWRLPTEGVLPLTASVEWGTEDYPPSAVKIPGLVAGLSAPMLGSLPASVGIEYAFFGRLCCRDEARTFPWYVHDQYTGGWVTGQTPFGDPMGGNGRAFRVHGTVGPWRGLLHLSSIAWVQDRFSGNLYAPQASGRSAGVRARAELRWSRLGVELSGMHERGDEGWRISEAAVEGRVRF